MTEKIIEKYVKQYERDVEELKTIDGFIEAYQYTLNSNDFMESECDIEELENRIDDNFLYFYKYNYPDNIKALEEYFNTKITKLMFTRYIYDELHNYDGDAWCDCVVIKEDKAKTILIDITHNYTWDLIKDSIKGNKNMISIDNITNETIKHILIEISNSYPYERKDIYDEISCI